jgi:hypothetical protein
MKRFAIASSVIVLLIVVVCAMNIHRLPAEDSCLNHLRQIDGMKQQWAQANRKESSDVPTWADLESYLGSPHAKIPTCPKGGIYKIGAVGEAPTCSIPGHKLL